MEVSVTLFTSGSWLRLVEVRTFSSTIFIVRTPFSDDQRFKRTTPVSHRQCAFMGNSGGKVEWCTGVCNKGWEHPPWCVQWLDGWSWDDTNRRSICRESTMGRARHTHIHCPLRSSPSHSNAFPHDRLLRLMFPVKRSFPPWNEKISFSLFFFLFHFQNPL